MKDTFSKITVYFIIAICITGGWFWWSCFPGCLPDGPPMGPFDSYQEALADARDGIEDDDE